MAEAFLKSHPLSDTISMCPVPALHWVLLSTVGGARRKANELHILMVLLA